jgi:hypothetical protein
MDTKEKTEDLIENNIEPTLYESKKEGNESYLLDFTDNSGAINKKKEIMKEKLDKRRQTQMKLKNIGDPFQKEEFRSNDKENKSITEIFEKDNNQNDSILKKEEDSIS